jgi:peptide/nickel transport system permease protein
MLRYSLRRLLGAIPLMWAVATLCFLLLEAAPGDVSGVLIPQGASPEVREAIIAKWQLEAPMGARYLAALANLLGGQLGTSQVWERPVLELILEALPATLTLAGCSLVVMFVSGLLLGSLQALRRGSWMDRGATLLSVLLHAVPSFWLAMVLVLTFSLWWPVLPASQAADPMAPYMAGWERGLDRLVHLILPAVALGAANAALIARHHRSALLEVLDQEWIRTARALGLSPWRVLTRHALPAALLPTVTLLGLSLPFLFSGSVVVERVFAWPGMGSLIFEGIEHQDTPLVLGCFLVYGLLVVLGGVLADLTAAALDPRIRLEDS